MKKFKKRRTSLTPEVVFAQSTEEIANGAEAKDKRNITPLLVVNAHVPMKYWSAGWVFKQISDSFWWEATEHSEIRFPATFREKEGYFGHPGYVLEEIGDYQVRICPLTSKFRDKNRYIPKSTRLEVTGFVWDKNSYLVEGASVSLPRKQALFENMPRFLGVCPSENLAQRGLA